MTKLWHMQLPPTHISLNAHVLKKEERALEKLHICIIQCPNKYFLEPKQLCLNYKQTKAE